MNPLRSNQEFCKRYKWECVRNILQPITILTSSKTEMLHSDKKRLSQAVLLQMFSVRYSSNVIVGSICPYTYLERLRTLTVIVITCEMSQDLIKKCSETPELATISERVDLCWQHFCHFLTRLQKFFSVEKICSQKTNWDPKFKDRFFVWKLSLSKKISHMCMNVHIYESLRFNISSSALSPPISQKQLCRIAEVFLYGSFYFFCITVKSENPFTLNSSGKTVSS